MIVRRALEGLEGVKKAEVSFAREQAIVYYKDEEVGVDKMVEAIRRVGFRARER